MHSQTVKVYGWEIDIIVDDDQHLNLHVKNSDKTDIHPQEIDVAQDETEWAERFTSRGIEDKFVANGECDSDIEPDNDTTSTEWQRNSAIHTCQARIENGAGVEESFKWLNDELARIDQGKVIYD